MKLYNTLSKKIEDVKPLSDNTIQMYSCGPTVYDHAHIGNLATFIYADTLKRGLKSAGYKVTHVMNITDVDDKTIRRSQEKYPNLEPKEALKKLTREYEDIFKQDMQSVGNDITDISFVRATDAIPEMQVLISSLYEQGFAYLADDGIYFSIEGYKKSGKVYGQLTPINSSNTSLSRISNDEYDKDSAHDFALWKFAREGEPSWEFKLGDELIGGRPGWHIECSAMSSMELGVPFDIHTGGVDLIFPHHENEIAQSTAGHEDQTFAKTFFHSEHLLVDDKKMAKSAGNFFTLQDITNKGFDPLSFRLMVLQSHYRKQANFSWENLQAAQNRLIELRAWADLRHQPSTNVMPEELDNLFLSVRQDMQKEIKNDLNTSAVLANFGKLISYMQNTIIPGVEGKYTEGTLSFLDLLLGLRLDNRPDLSDELKTLIQQREQARKQQDWQQSDQLRERLAQEGIEVRDTPNGPIWSRT